MIVTPYKTAFRVRIAISCPGYFFQNNITITRAAEVHWSSNIGPCVAIIVNLRQTSAMFSVKFKLVLEWDSSNKW
jgi:hypothetical protein